MHTTRHIQVTKSLLIVYDPVILRNEKPAQRVSFGSGYPANVHADIPADVLGQKLRSGPRNPGKNKLVRADIHDPKARTVHHPRAVQKNLGQKNFGLNFHSLKLWFPNLGSRLPGHSPQSGG